MRTPLIAIVVALAAPGVHAGDEVEERRAAEPDGVVRIMSTRGDLEIVGWARDEISVEGELDDLARHLRFVVKGDEALIRVELPDDDINWGDGSDLVVRVPAASRVIVRSVSADVELKGVDGAIAVRTVSGSIRATEFQAGARIRTVSGEVELADGGGRVDLATVSGDAKLELDATDVAVDTMSGEIEIELDGFSRLVATATTGELEIDGRLDAGGRLEASTVNGDIDVRLGEPIDARIEALAGPGGDIDNDLTDDEPVSPSPVRTELEAAVGDGSATVSLKTVNGEIRLGRS